MKRTLSLLSLAAGLAFASASHAAVNVAGTVFDDSAFADSLTASFGDYSTDGGGSLATVLTDNDVGTYAYSFTPRANVDLSFVDNLAFNGVGYDLALYDLGAPANFIVTINGITNSYITTGTFEYASGFEITEAFLDLDSFGIAAGGTISALNIRMDYETLDYPVPSLGLVGALNTIPVPEPSSYALMLAGLGMTGFMARRKAKRSV